MKRYLGFSIFVFYISTVFSQNLTILMEVRTGGQIEYYFDTQQEFTSGVTKSNYSQIQVYYTDSTAIGTPNPAPKGWRLFVKADNIDLTTYFGTQTIPCNSIEIEAVDAYGNGSGTWHTLSDSYVTPIASWDVGNMTVINSLETIYLSFRCGNSTNLSGEADGEYRGVLEFFVEENP